MLFLNLVSPAGAELLLIPPCVDELGGSCDVKVHEGFCDPSVMRAVGWGWVGWGEKYICR